MSPSSGNNFDPLGAKPRYEASGTPVAPGWPPRSMRHLLLRGSLLPLVCALSACGSAAVDAPGPAPVDPRLYEDASARPVAHVATPAEVALAERDAVAAVMNGLSVDGFAASIPLLDPDGNFSFPGLSEATDRDGAVVVLGNLFGAFSGRKFTLGRYFQAPQAVIAEWTMSGVQSTDWMGIKAAQRPVTIHGLGLFWFDSKGRVSDTHFYFDVGVVMAELGAGPKGVEPPSATAAAMATGVVTATGSEAEKHDVDVVNASWDAFEAKNEAGYLAPMADDIEVFRLGRANAERGKAERRKFFRWAAGGIGSLSQTPLNAWGIGSFVVEEYSLAGVHSGRLTDSPPSGHALRLHYVDIDELRDGKIVRMWVYGNSMELLAETGAVEKAAPGASAGTVK
jgi:ketosteroid isomerase-like protein